MIITSIPLGWKLPIPYSMCKCFDDTNNIFASPFLPETHEGVNRCSKDHSTVSMKYHPIFAKIGKVHFHTLVPSIMRDRPKGIFLLFFNCYNFFIF